MKPILTRTELFNRITHLVDVAAIAWLVLQSDSPIVKVIAGELRLDDADIKTLKKELDDFFDNPD